MITTTGIAVPDDMAAALAADPEALSVFEALRADDQREYVNWLARPGASKRSERLAEMASHVRRHVHRTSPVE